jgi:hypothetical protein
VQWSGFSQVCIRWCVFTLPNREKLLPQWEQKYGISPMCVLWWLFSSPVVLKHFLVRSGAYFLYFYHGVFLTGPLERNAFHSQSRSKASLPCICSCYFNWFSSETLPIVKGRVKLNFCVFSDELLTQLMLWSILHNQSRSKACLLCVSVHVVLSGTVERNSFHSQSRCKASLLCVSVHVVLSGPVERNSPHSQSRSKVSLLCVFSDEPLA